MIKVDFTCFLWFLVFCVFFFYEFDLDSPCLFFFFSFLFLLLKGMNYLLLVFVLLLTLKYCRVLYQHVDKCSLGFCPTQENNFYFIVMNLCYKASYVYFL
jgi:hypothetical protein